MLSVRSQIKHSWFAAFVFSPLLKWWWLTNSRLKLLWPSCRPAFAQPVVRLSLKAVVKSCHSLNYDIMSWLHKRTIIWGSSYQDRAKRRGFMSARKCIICIMCINHLQFTMIEGLKNSPGRPVGMPRTCSKDVLSHSWPNGGHSDNKQMCHSSSRHP